VPLAVAVSMLSGNADAQEEDFLPRVHYLLMTAELEKKFVYMPRGLVKQILSSHSRLQDNLETAHSATSDLQCELHYRDQEATEAKKAMTAMKAIRTTAIKLTRPRKAMKAMKAMKFMKPMKGKKAMKPMKATTAK
jgi:hypothetical protein